MNSDLLKILLWPPLFYKKMLWSFKHPGENLSSLTLEKMAKIQKSSSTPYLELNMIITSKKWKDDGQLVFNHKFILQVFRVKDTYGLSANHIRLLRGD